jgi:hypothetical protein
VAWVGGIGWPCAPSSVPAITSAAEMVNREKVILFLLFKISP